MRIFRLFGIAGLAVTVSATAALAQQAAASNLGGPKDGETTGAAIVRLMQETADLKQQAETSRAESATSQKGIRCIEMLRAVPGSNDWSVDRKRAELRKCQAG